MYATKFSRRSSRTAGSQVPRSAVSKAIVPRVPWASMTFQSLKNSHGEYVDPTLASLPLDSRTKQLGMKS